MGQVFSPPPGMDFGREFIPVDFGVSRGGGSGRRGGGGGGGGAPPGEGGTTILIMEFFQQRHAPPAAGARREAVGDLRGVLGLLRFAKSLHFAKGDMKAETHGIIGLQCHVGIVAHWIGKVYRAIPFSRGPRGRASLGPEQEKSGGIV